MAEKECRNRTTFYALPIAWYNVIVNNEGKIMGVTFLNDTKQLPDTVGKMRTIGIANDVQRFLRQTEKILKVAKAVQVSDSVRIIDHAIHRLEPDALVSMPDTGGLSLPCFNELCVNPTEDGLRDLVTSLKRDVDELYKMADVPGAE